ncbi:esterase [Glaciecola sp. MH2013]|nr:esterase [Glaciecola sp. MH2013]
MSNYLRSLRNITICLCACAVSPTALADYPIPVVSSGTIERLSDLKISQIPSRHIDVWLPDGYSSEQKYDVLYMHDAAMLFDANITWNKQEWMVDEVASTLMKEAKVRPFIVVAIPNGGSKRHVEFFPQTPYERLDDEYKKSLTTLEYNNAPLFDGEVYSDRYLAFLLKELIPQIEGRYSVNKGPQHRYLAGSSMGGLISWYAMMKYPNEFAGAACISTHWLGDFGQDDLAFNEFKRYMDERLPALEQQKLYFDYGDQTLDQYYPRLQRQIDAVMTKHYGSNSDKKAKWTSNFHQGENHSEASWSKRLHEPLLFLFSTQ